MSGNVHGDPEGGSCPHCGRFTVDDYCPSCGFVKSLPVTKKDDPCVVCSFAEECSDYCIDS